jgi:dTDP-glucose 4,6-dehydratase
MAYHHYYKLDTRIVRIFNTYGERMRLGDGRAIPTFMSQALRGFDVTIFGDGRQTRSVCCVSDLINGVYRLMMSHDVQPMNVGNPDELTMLQLAEEIVRLTGSESKVVYKPLPEDDPKVRQPDIALARKILHWEPRVNRSDGLRRTLEYFRMKLRV